MEGRIVQVNISGGGIPKLPVRHGAWIHEEGLEGDGCRNRKIHGGRHQAVLLISIEDLAGIRADGYDVAPGLLGENLTVQGLDLSRLGPGIRLRAGDALLQLTKIRKPCRTLEPFGSGIQKAVAGRGGYYASVIEPGHVKPGDAIRLEF